MTEQIFALRISPIFANEVYTRGLSETGSGFAKICQHYEAQIKRRPFTIKLTAEEIADIEADCDWVASRGCDWYPEEKLTYKAMLRQIAKLKATA